MNPSNAGEVLQALRAIPELAQGSEESLQRLANAGELHDVPEGTELYIAGSSADHVFGLVAGVLELSIPLAAGGAKIVEMRSAPGVVGEAAALDQEPRMVTARAAEPVRVAVISSDEWRACLTDDAPLCYAVALQLARVLREANNAAPS